jgi:ATP-dependent Clp protease ATP-binding subunit ClpB
MRFDKLTIKSQEALGEAQTLASSRGHGEITPAHLLRALLSQPEGSTVPVLQKLGVPIDPLQGELEKLLEQLPKVSGGAQAQLSPALSQVLEAGFQEADALKDEYVSTEHLLLAIAAAKGDAAGRLLGEAGAGRETPSPSTRPSRSSAATSPMPPARARWTRWWAATRRSAGWCRCSPAGPRTTRC